MAKVQIKSEKVTPFGGIFHVRELFSRYMAPIIEKCWGCDVRRTAISTARLWTGLTQSLRTEENKPYQSLCLQVLCKQSGIAERISVPAKWIRTARNYELNIYAHNNSLLHNYYST